MYECRDMILILIFLQSNKSSILIFNLSKYNILLAQIDKITHFPFTVFTNNNYSRVSIKY